MPSARVITFWEIREIALVEIRALEQRVLHERVVARELADRSVAEQVAAAVARVRHVDRALLGAERDRDHRRAHASVRPRVVGACEDLRVRVLHGRAQAVADRHLALPAAAVAEVPGDRARGHPARDLARLVPAHAVRHDEDVELREQDEAILVVEALPADVGDACRDRPHSSGV
jgi:hypothetical protein